MIARSTPSPLPTSLLLPPPPPPPTVGGTEQETKKTTSPEKAKELEQEETGLVFEISKMNSYNLRNSKVSTNSDDFFYFDFIELELSVIFLFIRHL